MLALASFGIYLGRFLRLNSWDVFLRPWKIAQKVSGLAEPAQAVEVFAFSVVFFLFSLGVYWQEHYRSRPWYGQRSSWEHRRFAYRERVVHSR